MSGLKKEFWTFFKAQLTAQIATLADFSLSLLLAEWAGLYYVTSSFLGALSGGMVNCAMNYRWVFKPEGLKKKSVASKYLLVWCGSIVLNTLGTYALTELSGEYFIYSKTVAAITVAVLWNYQLQRFFVYRDTHLMGKLKKAKRQRAADAEAAGEHNDKDS